MEHLKLFKLFESVTRKVFDNRVEYRNDRGQFHREDGPAVEYDDGEKQWYLNGILHREDGPAIECDDGDKYWYRNGERHREDGPAIEYEDGGKEWWINNKRHREDGPAIEYSDRYWYYLNDKLIYKSQFIKELANQPPNPNLFIDLPIDDLEELSADLCDKYIGEIKQWENFYAIYFKEKLDKNDLDLKSFENRIGDFRIRVGLKSILVY